MVVAENAEIKDEFDFAVITSTKDLLMVKRLKVAKVKAIYK